MKARKISATSRSGKSSNICYESVIFLARLASGFGNDQENSKKRGRVGLTPGPVNRAAAASGHQVTRLWPSPRSGLAGEQNKQDVFIMAAT
jgi:hypothetical protein